MALLLSGATAFSIPGATRFSSVEGKGGLLDAAAVHSVRILPSTFHESDGQGSSMALTGVVAMTLMLLAARRRAQRGARATTTRQAELPRGYVDPETGIKNYVNPWEQRTTTSSKSGWKFHAYTGPVYKQVPVIEGLEFPLDPAVYYPPLEPPPPGAKWGDGRSPDGNWYMEIDGKQVQYWQGVGKRKTACAIVRIVKGAGQFIVNGQEAMTFFQNYPIWWLKACEPLAALSQKNEFDILAKCFGGGTSGKAGAIRLALARAMQEHNYDWRPLLKKAKYLTRDWRMVEDKKTGQPKARKKTPYHKR